jgi:CubicO group peptidase (beta-lactamase class C family)
MRRASVAVVIALCATLAPAIASAAKPASAPTLRSALEQLARDGKFSGAVVIRGAGGIRFARGFGFADPFGRRRFTPDTPVDSASLAKPVTATAVLMLARDGRIDLDAPVRRYLPAFPYEETTVRHLLAHSAGLPGEEMLDPITGKTNEMFVTEMAERKLPALFPAGSAFVYCNVCYMTLAALIDQVTGTPYLQFVRQRVRVPAAVTIRPARLDDWTGRAIGYRRLADGKLVRADSYEDELFYGTGNFSITASQLALWGTEWWKPALAPIQDLATTPSTIAGKTSGMTLGNWYCAPGGERCHYLGHHEGFHHMLYWDRARRTSVAMVTNNTLAPALQQRVQRALVAFAERDGAAAERELAKALPDNEVVPGAYRLPTGERVTVSTRGSRVAVNRGGIDYPAFRIGSGIRYVPGLDLYVSGAENGGLHWLSLYEDFTAEAVTSPSPFP